jgi:spore coat polysaccharide biosynthesis protein SpsF
MEPACIDAVLVAYRAMPGCQYADNVTPRTFPHGLDVQVVSRGALETADAQAREPAQREHVLPFVQSQPDRFPQAHITAKGPSHAGLRITLDYPEDLTLIREIYERLYAAKPDFGLADILALQAKDPGLFESNRIRNMN